MIKIIFFLCLLPFFAYSKIITLNDDISKVLKLDKKNFKLVFIGHVRHVNDSKVNPYLIDALSGVRKLIQEIKTI